MTTEKVGGQPTPEQLRVIIGSPPPITGEFNLTPSVDVAIPTARMYEDTDEALGDQASAAYDEELRKHVVNKGHTELIQKRARLRLIRGSLGYGDHRLAKHMRITARDVQEGDRRLAQYLGITANQVQRGDLRGRRKKEVNRFEQRFNGLFTLSSILTEFVDDIIDRRVDLVTPNGKLSDVSIGKVVEHGYINIAVCIALETVRQNQKTVGYQQGVGESFP